MKYTVEPSATLLLLGGLSLVGSAASRLPFFPDSRGTVSDGWCIGSSAAWPGCPPIGTDVLLAEATVTVPAGHPGVLMVLAKTRVQGDASDPGGAARLWITIDGRQRGSIGMQELAAPFSISQRTIGASYLATGAGHLRPGPHQVQVHGSADGAFIHLVYLRDLPLLWFD